VSVRDEDGRLVGC